MYQVADPEQPPGAARRPTLRVKLRLQPGAAHVVRDGQRRPLRADEPLQLGDRLVTRAGGGLALLLAGQQWAALDGELRLLKISRRGEPPSEVRVELLRGEVRAMGSARGKGLRVQHGVRHIAADDGEFRVRALRGRLRVESVSAHVRIRGPHAERVVTPGAGLLLDAQPGFAQALPAAPSALRPIHHRARAAPLLRWDAVPDAQSYRLVIARDADFLVPEESVVLSGLSYQPRVTRRGKHFWKVTAVSGSARGRPSKVYSFDITRR